MFGRILLAIDDEASGEVAVSFVAALAKTFSSTVHVMHVNEYLVGGRGFTVETERETEQRVSEAVSALRAAGIRAEGSHYVTTCFDVGARIVDTAHDWSADVIVLGSRRHGRFARFAGKGMRERVTRLTALPVLTAPAPLKLAKGRPAQVTGVPDVFPGDVPTFLP
jgi:nucleotide-binding universal stress UspA family protein